VHPGSLPLPLTLRHVAFCSVCSLARGHHCTFPWHWVHLLLRHTGLWPTGWHSLIIIIVTIIIIIIVVIVVIHYLLQSLSESLRQPDVDIGRFRLRTLLSLCGAMALERFTNHHPSVLWYCWLGQLTRKIVSKMTYNVSCGTINPTMSVVCTCTWCCGTVYPLQNLTSRSLKLSSL